MTIATISPRQRACLLAWTKVFADLNQRIDLYDLHEPMENRSPEWAAWDTDFNSLISESTQVGWQIAGIVRELAGNAVGGACAVMLADGTLLVSPGNIEPAQVIASDHFIVDEAVA
jgi:hypothetical protein